MAREMTVFIKCKDLVKYTFDMTDNTKRFSKKRRFTFTNRMQNLVIDVFSKLKKANDMPKSERVGLQADAIGDVSVLLLLIEISFEKGFIDGRQLEIWARKARDVKFLAIAWKNKTK